MVGIPNWVPFYVGLAGAMMVNPFILQVVGFPRNFLQHGIFLIIQALFANIGYCGKIGVAAGYFSIAVGVLDLIASAFHIKSDRMKDLQLVKDHPDYSTHEDDDDDDE
ncbi:unnamed protein product [Durusdinium trenchii]|uniref:Uncharacterized protein n=1 Tax=Durusdinium trenchii TaxID=1381693 RepID=A0ABP0S1R6_9DINO